eukprot:1566150-Alexandrium_andersonii.AAC.1
MLKEGMYTHYSRGKSSRCHHHFVPNSHPTVVDGKEQAGVRQRSTVAVYVDFRGLYNDGAY